MKNRLTCLMVTAFVTACSPATDAAAPAPAETATPSLADEEQAIRSQIATWLDLIKAKDAAAIAALYTADGAVMPPNAAIGKGPEAIEKTWAAMMQAPGFGLTFAPETIVVAQSGDLAMDRGTYRMFMAPGGKEQVDTGKYVVVWRKEGGTWKAAADIINSDLPAS